MKTLTVCIFMSIIMFSSVGQVVSNVNWELEGNERIVITYDLARLDDYIYFDVSVVVKVEEKVVAAKALSGDVGNFVRIGTNKKIVWNIFEDISELNGALSVEVLAFNPVPSTTTSVSEKSKGDTPPTPKMPTARIPFWAGMGGIGVTGVGLLTAGIKSAGEGQDLYKIYKENTIETAALYTDLGSTREEVYEEANKKYKNGSLLQIAGAAILVTAGAMIVNRMIQSKKVVRAVALSPYINVNSDNESGKVLADTGLSLRYRLGYARGR